MNRDRGVNNAAVSTLATTKLEFKELAPSTPYSPE